METWYQLSAILRTILYFYICLTSSILTILYYRAYWKFKTTPIIQSLKIFLLTLSLMFAVLSLVSASYVLGNVEKYKLMVSLLVFPAFLLAVGVTGFYLKSTEDTKDSKKSDKIHK